MFIPTHLKNIFLQIFSIFWIIYAYEKSGDGPFDYWIGETKKWKHFRLPVEREET